MTYFLPLLNPGVLKFLPLFEDIADEAEDLGVLVPVYTRTLRSLVKT